jgi:hypothetical protein
MKRKHGVPIYGTPAAKANAFQLCFVPAFTGALQYSAPFGLGYRRQDSNYHFSHFPVSAYPVINKPDGHPLGVEIPLSAGSYRQCHGPGGQFLTRMASPSSTFMRSRQAPDDRRNCRMPYR